MKRQLMTSCILLIISLSAFGQEKSNNVKKESTNYSLKHTVMANSLIQKNEFIAAEKDYRIAIAKNEKNTIAKYNLGNAYLKNNKLGEAHLRYKDALKNAKTKKEKASIFHNMGNLFMLSKDYNNAKNAYQNALMHNPEDDETRYNYVMAKRAEEKQKKDKKNKNQNNKDNKNKERKNQKGKNNNKKDNEEKKKDEKNSKNKGDKKNQKKDKKELKQQKRQLSLEQIKNLLDAVKNEEKKVQKKIKKRKTNPAGSHEKDW